MHILIGLMAALAGIWVSHKIYMDKQGKTVLACPRDGGCNIVLHSTHAKFFGIGNETMGLVYFSLVGLVLAACVFFTSSTLRHIALFLSTAGILYSVYLIYIQAGILKKWCWWCVSVAGINFILWSSILLLNIR